MYIPLAAVLGTYILEVLVKFTIIGTIIHGILKDKTLLFLDKYDLDGNCNSHASAET